MGFKRLAGARRFVTLDLTESSQPKEAGTLVPAS